MKKCNKCCEIKSFDEFYKDRTKNDGYTTFCIECKKKSNKESRLKNIETIKLSNKKYREENKEIIKIKRKIHYDNNKDKYSEYQKKYRDDNKDEIKKRDKIYYENNKDKIMENYYDNREHNLIRMKSWKKNNREKIRLYQNEYNNNRRKNDNLYKITLNIRSLIHMSLKKKGIKKNSKTSNILGCTFEEFKIHLESKFEPWMTWDNYGLYNGELNYGWDIDHIIPNSSATTEEELLKLNHFSNLQPLCSYINRDIKKNKVD